MRVLSPGLRVGRGMFMIDWATFPEEGSDREIYLANTTQAEAGGLSLWGDYPPLRRGWRRVSVSCEIRPDGQKCRVRIVDERVYLGG